MFKNQKFINILKSLIVVAIFFSCYSVTLAGWTPPNDTPPDCNPGTLGCNPPINVSPVGQVKPGQLTLGVSDFLPNFLSEALKALPATIKLLQDTLQNTIVSQSDFLNIFGHGTSPERQVKIWDNLTVPGDIWAYNYYRCTETGSCTELTTNGDSVWEKNVANNSIYYNSGNVGIGTNNPSEKLDVQGNINLGTSVNPGKIMMGGNLFMHNTGVSNTFLGINSGSRVTAGKNNTALGANTLNWNGEGEENTAIGYNALFKNTTGKFNTAQGSLALQTNTTGSNNTAQGRFALGSNSVGSNNVAVGYDSLARSQDGSRNTALGAEALYQNGYQIDGPAGSENTAVGYRSLYSHKSGNGNTSVGINSLYSNVTGVYNSALGANSLYANTTGIYNSAFGVNSLKLNTVGKYNSAHGANSLSANTTGNYNSAYGLGALRSNTTGNNNTTLGLDSLRNNTTGNNNVAVGYVAGYYTPITGVYNLNSEKSVYLGSYARASASGNINEIAIGYNASGAGSNSVVLGNNSIQNTFLKGKVGINIGTTTPGARLEVGGTVKLTPQALTSDPAGSNGMIYYNQTMKKFRCYEDGTWFNCFSAMTSPPPTVSAVSVAGVASGWPSGETKQVSFTYANFSGTTNTVALSVCHPVNSEPCLSFSSPSESLTLSGGGNSVVSKTHGSLVYQRLVDGDSLITPYFDASRRTKIKVCPTNTAGVVPPRAVCAFSAPYTITAPTAPTTYTLTITKSGTGDGSFAVTPTGTYAPGTRVMAMASASTGSVFAGWSGDCSGTGGTIDIIMDRNKSCVATFNLATAPCVRGDWSTCSYSPCAMNCTKTCTQTRTVSPAGCDTTTKTTLSSCSGDFCPAPTSKYEMTLTTGGEGSGTVDGDGEYNAGAMATITATPNTTTSEFDKWTSQYDPECNNKTTRTLNIAMDEDKTCKALFKKKQFTLTINKSGDGVQHNFRLNDGTGERTINIPTTRILDYLTAVAIRQYQSLNTDDTSLFTGFSGDCTGATCPTISMNRDKTVTATYRDVRRLTTLRLPAGVPGGSTCTLTMSGCDVLSGPFGDPTRTNYIEEGDTCKLTVNFSGIYTKALWGGDCSYLGVSNSGTYCNLPMTSHKDARVTCQI